MISNMRVLNLAHDIIDSELVERVKRFVYNNQYSLPVCIESNNHKLVMMVLEEGDFRFIIEGDSITVTH
jgi:hypothetical protein